MKIEEAIQRAGLELKNNSQRVNTGIWQSVDVSNKPDMETMEVLNHTVRFDCDTWDLDSYRNRIQPNLPWADDHFEERVCGFPLNPGKEWANWPWGLSADKFRNSDGRFNHNYMERYWPRMAGDNVKDEWYYENPENPMLPLCGDNNYGIHDDRYGDLNDVIRHLGHNPHSRQAYVPIFFPEDTGVHHGGRVPCTLGYHFILRNNNLHCVYYLRSCDFYRHFRDDIYLTVRLQLWLLDRLRVEYPDWDRVTPGSFTMHITSLHCFINDYIQLFGGMPEHV